MMKFIKILVLIQFLIGSVFISAQDIDSTGKPVLTLKNPRNTMFVHYNYLKDEYHNPEIAAKTLNVNGLSKDSAITIAINLKKIIDGNNLIIDFEKIPADSNYNDSVSGLAKFVPFAELPEIYLEKINGKWLFSDETVRKTGDLYLMTFPYDTKELIESLPSFWQNTFLTMKIWQWTGILLFIIGSIILYYILSWIIGYLLVRFKQKLFKRELLTIYIKRIAKPISFLLVVLIIDELISILELNVNIGYYIDLLVKILIPLSVTFIAYRLSDLVGDFFGRIASRTETKIDDQIVPMIRKALKVIIVVFGGLYIINNLGVNITPLLAGVSIGGIAIALAAQDMLKNLFGSVTIFADRPFEIGDWIIFDGSEGIVEEVGIRSTRIRAFNNSLISIPNGQLSDMKIDNMGKRIFRRYRSRLSILYSTSPELIDKFVVGLRKIVEDHEFTRKDSYQVYLNDLADSAIIVLFNIFFIVNDIDEELKAKHEIISSILKYAAEIGVEFAFPTQTIHLEKIKEN